MYMIIFMAALVSLTAAAQPVAQVLPQHTHQIVSRLTPVGRMASTNRLRLAVGLPLRNQADLEKFLNSVADPGDPNYRHYLTSEQFADRFGPTEQDYRSVAEFFRTNGFAVTGEYSNRVLLDISGSARDVERVFHVNLRTYRHPTEGRVFFAPDTQPSVELPTRILNVNGLSDFPRPHPRLVTSPHAANFTLTAKGGSGPGGTYLGNDFRATYAPGVTLTGAGQSVALVQFDGYYLKDITNYENAIGISAANYVPLTNILIDGYNGVPTTGPSSGNPEVSLDIEMVIAMAPGISRLLVYEGSPTTFIPNDVLNRIAADNAARQISSSWGWSGGQDPTTEQIFKQMIAQGQTYYNASGDSDAFIANQVDDPALSNQPTGSTNIVQVGGTTLTATNPIAETAWNRGSGVGTSGGISLTNAIPAWQTNINMVTNHGSTTRHNIPDVSLTAESIHVKYGNGSSGSFGGTSCAAPLWAGFTALINQRATQAGQPPVGFIVPAVYALGKSTNYNAVFNDTTNGNNFWTSSPTNFPAVPGYDLCTGWGTPKGSALINALAMPDPLGVVPGLPAPIIGPMGGPFIASTLNFGVSNSGGAALTWSLSGVPPWLTASATSGSLPGNGPGQFGANVALSVNTLASNLLAGSYATNLVFSNSVTHVTQIRPVVFQPGLSIIPNGGFENGAFTPWNLFGTGGGFNFIGTAANSPSYIHSGAYAAFLGESGFLDYFSETLPTIPGQRYLVSFWLRNPSGATPNQFVMNWNTNSPATNTVLNLTNITFTAWTNAIFLLTATGTNTVLQFGARNDADYFGFDDVSVQAVPAPTFRSAVNAANQVVMTFNSLTGIQYQVQFSTNLSSTNWFIQGTNTATDFTFTFTNAIGTNPVRFYRIRQLP